MKAAWITFVITSCLVLHGRSQSLFHAPQFTIARDRVLQGHSSTIARSDSELISTYRSPFKIRTRRVVDIKFSINGFDNERVVGQNHRLSLRGSGGKVLSPIYVFGEPDSTTEVLNREKDDSFLDEDVDVVVRLDLRKVMSDFKTKGYFTTFNGQKISAGEFKGVFIAGGSLPLSWNFSSLPTHPEFQLTDTDSDGIYEVSLHFKKEQEADGLQSGAREWKLKRDVSAFPSFHSPFVLVDALYNLSLEEMMDDVRGDGAFMAGAMWPGVWTRDLSYSIMLSLAMVHPDASRASLMAKVKSDHIIQDTGTGGSWPVSSDRLVWAIAAWELYKVNGDQEWLRRSYRIIRNSVEEDMHAAYDSSSGLFYGESSFLDWREQTYPRWMDSKDIYKSKNLGTNAVHYEALTILAAMAERLGESPEPYSAVAQRVKSGMNSLLWLKEKNYYGQYLYGRNYLSVSHRSETLGEALSVLFGIPDHGRAKQIIESTPTTQFGVPCIFPQIPNIPPYHNDAIWPFVEAYWGWASARVGNGTSVENALGSMVREASLFLTNKENMVASTGDYMGTEINSGRQLWSVAGDLAMVYRVIFGMEFTPESLSFTPFVPPAYDGAKSLVNFKYRESVLDIYLNGYGNTIKSVMLDGKKISHATIAGTLVGRHTLVIALSNSLPSSSIAMEQDAFSPETPRLSLKGDTLAWQPVPNATRYVVVKNGWPIDTVRDCEHRIDVDDVYAEYQISAVDKEGHESFLSEPVVVCSPKNVLVVQAEEGRANAEKRYEGSTGSGYVSLQSSREDVISFPVHIGVAGTYAIDFRYANGNGPINTDNKCALRTLRVDRHALGVVVFPQRGEQVWTDWGFTNSLPVSLSQGDHTVSLSFDRLDNNMNGDVNSALVDFLRLRLLNNSKK